MHRTLILQKDHLLPLLRKLGKSSRLVAPVRNRFGDIFFTEIEDLDAAAIDLENQSQTSLKSFFLPQSETLCRYVTGRNPESGRLEYSFHAQLPPEVPTVYFGVRSCDLFAVMYTDLVFRQASEKDVYYSRRRADAVFISIGCARPYANCFCNATRSGPFLDAGFDLQLTDLGDRWFVQIGRPRGVRLIEEWPAFFTPATEADKKAQFQVELEARGLFARHVHVDLAVKLLQELPDHAPVFAELSRRCQDCGGCAYICPTCTCFTITDLRQDDEIGERRRCWDACTYSGFTRMAGDSNPVDGESQRIRKRFLHKLLHDVRKHGRPSCVGCGRCVGMCFGGVDIIRFIEMLTAEGENGHKRKKG
ncbi:MAG: 4Fe-4S dicluster domain-containing protein [Desulfobulbaceae bacterium]